MLNVADTMTAITFTMAFFVIALVLREFFLDEGSSTPPQRDVTPRHHKIKEVDPLPQGSLIRVIVPDDPIFRSEWDGMMGVVTGVDEEGKWYRVMFSTRQGLKFQTFGRKDLKWMGELR